MNVVHGDVAALTLLVELAHGVFRGDVAIPTGLLTHSDLRIPESCEADDLIIHFTLSPAVKVHGLSFKVCLGFV